MNIRHSVANYVKINDYDYDKTIKGKTNDIQSLEQQIRALEGVAGQEAAAKRANLMAQRKEAQEDLDDTVKEHIYNMQIEGLDDMMDTLNKNLDDWRKELHSDLGAQQDAINKIVDELTGKGQPSETSIASLLNGTNGKNIITNTLVNDILTRVSTTLSKEGDKTDTKTGDISVTETTGNGGELQKGTPTGNTTAGEAISGAKAQEPTPAPAPAPTPTPAPVPATPKQTVTATQASNALSYIMSKVKYASKQNSNWGVFNKTLYNHDKNRKVMIEASDAKKAWEKLGFGAGSYTPQKLLDATKASGIWDVLIQIRTDKKGNITKPTWNAVHGYAKGGTVHKSGRYMTDEKGEEIIITKQGILRPLSAGTSIIPADITERLYAIASNYDMGANARVHGIDASKLTRIGGETISPIINCPITIEGNANEQDVINAINKTLPKISKHVQNDIRKDLRKSGR